MIPALTDETIREGSAAEQPFDPYRPLLPGAGKLQPQQSATRHAQRARRARILAVTRQLLGERGCEEVTVREIARSSGFALQTIYNLVGPRDRTIIDAISEYALYVGRMADREGGAPSLLAVIDTWITAAEAAPEFARQTNLILFTPSRNIYYHFRDIQIRGVAKLLRHQQASGQAFFHTPPRLLAEQIVFFAMAIWIDWADRPFAFPLLRQKLAQGLTKLMRE